MPPPARPGRPRSSRAHRAVIEAVIALLGDRGFAGMSVEAVADRAGVSKATIYRHWPSKEALCGEAVACIVVSTAVAGSGSPRRELRALLLELAGALERSDAGRLLPHLASAAATDPRLAEIWRQSLVEPARRRVVGLLRRAVDAAELAADTDLDLAAELLLAPLFYRRLVTGERTTPGVDRLIGAVWAAWAP